MPCNHCKGFRGSMLIKRFDLVCENIRNIEWCSVLWIFCSICRLKICWNLLKLC